MSRTAAGAEPAAAPELNQSQQRVLRLLLVLAGHEVHGLSPGEIREAMECDAPCVTRDMHNLHAAGFAELVPETKRWRLSPVPIQLALRHMAAMDRAQRRLDETTNRYSRS